MSTLAERFPQKEPRRPRIPGYEVGEVLGRGASGVVFRARQQAVDREVALKVLHAALSDQPRVIQRLQREARTTARLAHPHVVSAIDMGQTNGQWWYAMEFVDGPSLAARLRQEGRLTEREALRLFIPLCEALEHLWEHGVVHRDIKPANILIDRAGGARIADLGLAFADDDPSVTKQGGTLGTPHYISPEQTVDPRQADARSDIWSFGATLFHAVCGRTPFTGDSAAEILSNVLYSRVPDPRELEPSLSKGLTLVLRKCLNREPEGRYQTPHELLLDLERVRERRQPKVSRRALDPVKKEREAWKVWLPVTAILLLGVGIPFLLLGPLTRLDEAGPVQIGQRGELLPYRPLEDLAERAASESEADAMLALQRSELAALRHSLPEAYEARWAELDRDFSGELGRRVRKARNDAKVEIVRALEARDYRAASAILEVAFPEAVFHSTGYRVDQLEAEGVPVEPWIKVQRNEIDERATVAARELQEALAGWSASVQAEVDRLEAAQQWDAALRLLVEDRDAILAASNHASVPLPEDLLDAAVDNSRTEMLVKRLEVRDEWTRLDQNLRRWVTERAASLRRELEDGPPRPPVADNLADAFGRELERRRLSRRAIEGYPRELQRTCIEELDRSVGTLRGLEEKLLEEDARADVAETMRFCEPHWHARRYEEAQNLWSEALARLRGLEKRTQAAWRAELETTATIRQEEARLLARFLEHVARSIRDLNGQVIDSIRPGLVDYFKVQIESGDDPLVDGFQAAGVRDRLYLREPAADAQQPFSVLRSEQIEKFYGQADGELSEVERLTLAAFRFYEGHFDDARAMLRGGPLPEVGVQAEIQADLLKRVFDSIEVDQAKQRDREAEADDLLAKIDSDDQARAPSAVRQRVDLLITQFADLQQVRERLGELRALSRELRQQADPSDEERIVRIYDPTEVSFPSSREVVMAFEFDSLSRGAWQRGDWVFDGGGWARTDKVQRWEELADQRGPRLFLNEPLDPDSLLVEVTFEQLWPGPPQLVLISVGGFHVAFCGSGLPGDEHTPRYLIGTGELEEFIERIRSGEGTADDQLVQREATHTVRIFVYRPGGSGSRLKLEFDGRLLDEVPRALLHDDVPAIEFRSWEPVTLKRVVVETGR